ncbi:MAG: hypothetical protein HBSIN02_15440 [Bacteroidia bacterium]|nr:MAG: hypothetical protein HBSIN02_15440 [Bacteroidia bacterium]
MAVAIRGDLIKRISTRGMIRSAREAEIVARVNGEVTAVHVANGSYVNSGDLLFEIDNREHALALARAQAAFLQALVDFKSMAEYETSIGSNDATRDEKMNAARDRMRDAERQFQAGVISDEEYQRAVRAFRIDSVFYSVRREDVIANRSGLAAAQEAYERARLNLEYTRATSPFGGFVADCDLAVGEYVRSGETVARIVDVSSFFVDVDVLESEAAAIRTNADAEIKLTAYPSIVLTGKVRNINPVVDLKSRSIRITVELRDGTTRDKESTIVRPGMSVEVRIVSETLRDRILVPRDALLVRDQRTLVFVAKEGRAQWQYIDVGEANDRFLEIRSGVNAGDSVIVDGHYTLAHDARIQTIVKE